MIVVIFTEDLRVDEALCVPRALVNELFAWNEHVAGRIITVTKSCLSTQGSDELLDVPVKARG